MQKQYIFLLFCLLVIKVNAQQDLGIHFMDGVWQSNLTNPAKIPEHKFVLALPGFYNHARIDNFTYNNVVSTDAQGNTIIDVDNVIDAMGPNNIIRNQADLSTIALGVQVNRVFLQVGHSAHLNAYFDYPKELAQVLWQGNAQFIGQVIDIAPDVVMQAYHSFFVGAAGEIAPGVYVGGRFKVLNGVADLSTGNRELQLLTDEAYYQTQMFADLTLNSTGALNYDGFNSSTQVDFEQGNFDLDQIFAGNNGLAIDLGVTMQYNRLTLAFSALDLGTITWKEDATNISLQGEYEYQGLDILKDAVLNEASTIEIADTLEAIYNVEETSTSYSTGLPAKFFLSGTYALTEKTSLGGLAYIERFREKTAATFGLSLNAKLTKFFSVGGLYSFNEQESFRLGANTAIRLGPVQLVAATDNLLTAFRLEDSNSANFRLGLNLVFGRKEEQDIDSIFNQDDFFR
jgi:hypothetical protein